MSLKYTTAEWHFTEDEMTFIAFWKMTGAIFSPYLNSTDCYRSWSLMKTVFEILFINVDIPVPLDDIYCWKYAGVTQWVDGFVHSAEVLLDGERDGV